MRALLPTLLLLTGCGLDPFAEGVDLHQVEVGVDMWQNLYGADLTRTTVQSPATLTPIFGDVQPPELLFYVAQQGKTTFSLQVAQADEDGVQDPCGPVTSFDSGTWKNGEEFKASDGQFPLVLRTHEVAFRSAVLTAHVDPETEEWRAVKLEAQIDARELEGVLPAGTDACELIARDDMSCHACASDGEERCLTLSADLVVDLLEGTLDPDPSGC